MISKENIDSGKAFDWGQTSAAYAKYRDIYPSLLYDRLRALGVAKDGTAWLDLGTGTGVLPQNLYNEKATIVATDISKEQIRFAKETACTHGQNITFFAAPAENTGLPDHTFDSITAAQCFWYFQKDTMQTEIPRLLKDGGRFIKILLDWAYDDPVAAESIRLVQAYNPQWNPNQNCVDDMFDDLFDGRKTEEYDCALPFTREGWHGRMCACRGTLASMDKATFEDWSKAHIDFLSALPESFSVRHKLYLSIFEV